MSDSAAFYEKQIADLHFQLAERDKEIERGENVRMDLVEEADRLRSQLDRETQLRREAESLLADRTFSQAEIKALLKLASEGDDGYLSDEEYVALESAMATLEKMRDE